MVGRNELYRHRGAAMYCEGNLVDSTLRVSCQYRIVLRFMGTVEQSLMTGQFRTRVWYMG